MRRTSDDTGGTTGVAAAGGAHRDRFALLVVALVVMTAGVVAVEARPASTTPAAAAGKNPVPMLNAYFAADFTDVSYQQAAVNRVLKTWKPPAPLPAIGKKTVVISMIGRDGALLSTQFNMTSGSEAFDSAALEAVKKAAPFAAFPASYTRPTAEVHWHFQVTGR